MAIKTREQLEMDQIRAEIRQSRMDTDLSAIKLSWYEKLIYIGIGAVAVNGIPDIIAALRGAS